MDIAASLGLEVDSRPVNRAGDSLNRFRTRAQGAERAATGFERAGRGMAASAARIAGSIAGMVVSAVGFGAAVRVIADFERSMAQVGAITRATDAEMVRLRATAAALGTTTEFTAAQAAGGLRFLGMAGFTAAEGIAAIPAVLDLATAASMDLAQAADTASNIMSAFGIAAADSADVADVLAAASSRANTDVSQLGSAMSFVGPVASALAIDLGDAAAAVGVLSDAGIQGSAAGTGLRRVLSSLANPTEEAVVTLQRLGVAIGDVNPQANDLTDIVETLAASGLSAADALTIFGDRGGPAILALVSQNDRLRELTAELGNVEGEARRMAETMRDNLGGDLDSLWSSVQGLVIALGDAGLTAALRALIGLTTEIVRGVSSLINGFSSLMRLTGRLTLDLFGIAEGNQAVTDTSIAAAAGINQEIAMSDALTGSLTEGREMSIDVAGVKLAQARAHLASADAQRQELEQAIRASAGYQELVERQMAIQAALAETRANLNTYEGDVQLEELLLSRMQDQLAALRSAVAAQQDLLAVAGETDAEYTAAIAAIELIETALANATGETIILGEAAGDAADEGERLSYAVSGIDFGSAITGAQELAASLGISLNRAMAMMGLIGAEAQAANMPIIYDPRDPRYDAAAAERGSALERTRQIMAEIRAETEAYSYTSERLADSLNEVEGATIGVSGATEEAAKKIEEATTFADGFADALEKGVRSAADMGRELGGALLRGIDSVSNAFGDFVARGFRDFRGFAQAVLDTFRNLLSQMIAMAVRNRIMIGLGISGGGVAAVGKSIAGVGGGGGGLLGGLFGGGGGILGSFGNAGGIFGMGGLGGGAGLLGGLGNALSGGLGNIFSIGANAAAAGGGILASIGAALPVLGIAAAAFSLLRTRTKQTNNGLAITIDQMGVLAREFTEIKKVRAFGGRSYRTTYKDADAETQAFVEQTVQSLQDGVRAGAEALGFATDIFDNFAADLKVSFYGMDESEAAAALEAALRGVGDDMAALVDGLEAFSREGEGAYDTLTRLANSLVGVNYWMGNLGLALYDIGLAGGDAASAFVDLFGSLDQFNAAASIYYQNFFSDSERLARATELLSAEFAQLGAGVMPRTRRQFRDMVEAADAAGDSDLVAALLQLAPAFAEITEQAINLDDALNSRSMFRTLADQVFANSSAGYTTSAAKAIENANIEERSLLREILTAIRSGDLNNARIQSKILAIQERADLEPAA